MKRTHHIILVLILSSLCIGGFLSVSAVTDHETINDGTGDVIDALGEIVQTSPNVDIRNIDITKLTYDRVDTQVTVAVTVDGTIEDRGALADLLLLNGLGGGDTQPTSFNINAVGYFFTLETDNESYAVFYVNKTCQVQFASDPDHPVNLTSSDFTVEGNTLTIRFTINTSDEVYQSITVQSSYIKLQFSLDDLNNLPPDANLEDMMIVYTDEAPNPALIVDAEITNLGTTSSGAYLGTVNSPVQFNGTAVYGQPPYTYSWKFGDGGASSELNPRHTYTSAQTYTYNFTVTDSSGDSDSQTGSIVINTEEPGNGSSNNNMLLLAAIIVIIVIIGIVVIVWIIRR